jgi:hypothetical protein
MASKSDVGEIAVIVVADGKTLSIYTQELSSLLPSARYSFGASYVYS